MRFGKVIISAVFMAGVLAAPHTGFAAGDVAKGKKAFKKCGVCHALEEGKNKIGPSLFKVIGRQAGVSPKYKYSASYVEAGKKGLKWDQEKLIAYLENPKKFMRAFLESKKAKSKMTTKYKKLKVRTNVAAYLDSLK